MSRTVSDYTFNPNECFGQGTFGNLHKGKNRKTNQVVILRLIQKQFLKSDKMMGIALTEELAILQRTKHPKINPILEIFETQIFFYIVFPFCTSNLKQILKKQRKLSEQEMIKMINDLTDGFSELVKQGIIHRDLKPSNILFEKDSYIISDPGFATALESFRKGSKTKPQNFAYVAPQVLEKKQKYTNKCDIWSLGMILYECIMGVLPFQAQNVEEHLKLCKSKKVEIPQGIVSDEMKSFIENCLVYDEDKRLDWSQVILHPLINEKSKEESKAIADSIKRYLMTEIRQKIIKNHLDFEELFDNMDTDKNGSLDLDEFSAFLLKIDKKLTKDDCYYVFKEIDEDNSGSISLEEFELWLSGNNSKMTIFDMKQATKLEPNVLLESQVLSGDLQTLNLEDSPLTENKQQLTEETPKNQFNTYPQFSQSQPLQPPPQQILSPTIIPSGAGYGKSEKLEQAMLDINQQINAKQIDILKLFKKYDVDKDNFLNFQEFQLLIRNLTPQLTLEEIVDLFRVFNLNDDEMISFVEFRLVTSLTIKKKQQLPVQIYPPQGNANFSFQNIKQQPNQAPFFGKQPMCGVQPPSPVYPPQYNLNY